MPTDCIFQDDCVARVVLDFPDESELFLQEKNEGSSRQKAMSPIKPPFIIDFSGSSYKLFLGAFIVPEARFWLNKTFVEWAILAKELQDGCSYFYHLYHNSDILCSKPQKIYAS